MPRLVTKTRAYVSRDKLLHLGFEYKERVVLKKKMCDITRYQLSVGYIGVRR